MRHDGVTEDEKGSDTDLLILLTERLSTNPIFLMNSSSSDTFALSKRWEILCFEETTTPLKPLFNNYSTELRDYFRGRLRQRIFFLFDTRPHFMHTYFGFFTNFLYVSRTSAILSFFHSHKCL